MSRSIDDLIAALRSFEPTPDEAENVHRLNEIFDGFHLFADREEALPEIFFLLERFPLADFGTPIPLARELERLAAYPKLLAASLERQPTELAIWMANRLLNSQQTREQRTTWLQHLTAVTTHPLAAAPVRDSALRCLDFQAGRPMPAA